MTRERLAELLGSFPRLRAGVIGDFFLDKHLEIDPSLAETSLETGRTAHQVVRVRKSPGAAGNVAANLAALGAGSVHAVGYIGDDGEGYDLVSLLEGLGCSTGALAKTKERVTPTYMKPRDVNIPGLEGEFERMDIKNRTATPPGIEEVVMNSLEMLLPELDVLLIVDQVGEEDCGVVTGKVRTFLSERAARCREVVFLADSRSNILHFRNVIIKANEREILGDMGGGKRAGADTRTLKRAVVEAGKRTGAPVFVTRGSRGIMVGDPEPDEVEAVRVPEPVDTTGAGDSAAAGIALALAAGAECREAALVGNLVASVTVRRLGMCGTCTRDEALHALDVWLEQRH